MYLIPPKSQSINIFLSNIFRTKNLLNFSITKYKIIYYRDYHKNNSINDFFFFRHFFKLRNPYFKIIPYWLKCLGLKGLFWEKECRKLNWIFRIDRKSLLLSDGFKLIISGNLINDVFTVRKSRLSWQVLWLL